MGKAVGTMNSCFPGVLNGPLYYRHLEQVKTKALKESKENLDVAMSVSVHANLEVN